MRRLNDRDSLSQINASLRALGLQHESGDLDTDAYLTAQRQLLAQALLACDPKQSASAAVSVWVARGGKYLALLMVGLTLLALISFFVN